MAAVAGVFFLLLGLRLHARSQLPERRDPVLIAADLEADLAALEARSRPRPPPFDEPAEGTAWDHDQRAVLPILNAGGDLPEGELIEAAETLGDFEDPGRELPDSQIVLRPTEATGDFALCY
jgi:hypothetical protein